jgi:DNA (cytosine-5)-methyltransferase 1
LWENVEGVLNDRTNAFGNFIAGLAGFDKEIQIKKWSKSGFIYGKTRNVAWRVIDAKHFGLPQQRKRLYVLAGGINFRPDKVLFELDSKNLLTKLKVKKATKKIDRPTLFDISEIVNPKDFKKVVQIEHNEFEFFREYTDCLYAAYGTKWNGNAAAYNGSLYVAQNNRIRRFIPLECERLMGFPDNYTLVNGHSDTNRYQAVGNSWAVPVVKWIGEQIHNYFSNNQTEMMEWTNTIKEHKNNLKARLFLLDGVHQIAEEVFLNTSSVPNNQIQGSLENIVQLNEVPEKFYLSPQACKGILRRKFERDINMNESLQNLLTKISEPISQKRKANAV